MAYSKECIETFLKKQRQLFDEDMASDASEAEEFLEESLAVVVNSEKEIRKYFEESGMDTVGVSDKELLEASEVFALPSGRFLIVEA